MLAVYSSQPALKVVPFVFVQHFYVIFAIPRSGAISFILFHNFSLHFFLAETLMLMMIAMIICEYNILCRVLSTFALVPIYTFNMCHICISFGIRLPKNNGKTAGKVLFFQYYFVSAFRSIFYVRCVGSPIVHISLSLYQSLECMGM